jgi:hypothetical protein
VRGAVSKSTLRSAPLVSSARLRVATFSALQNSSQASFAHAKHVNASRQRNVETPVERDVAIFFLARVCAQAVCVEKKKVCVIGLLPFGTHSGRTERERERGH